jgi:hypothetical protein
MHSFRDLDRERRYALVLGHELAHVFYLFSDSTQIQMFEELRKETEAFYQQRRLNMNSAAGTASEQSRVERIQVLRSELERPAENLEKELYRELRGR